MAMTEVEERELLHRGANRTGCACGTWFLWRLKRGGAGWHCYNCEPMPKAAVPAKDLDIINAWSAPMLIMRAMLGN